MINCVHCGKSTDNVVGQSEAFIDGRYKNQDGEFVSFSKGDSLGDIYLCTCGKKTFNNIPANCKEKWAG